MMYSQGFVVAVKKNGKVLREMQGEVFLPFYSEYSLLLKNNKNRRCCCSVSIDGTDVLGGKDLIINSNSSLELERFLVDGDLNKGERFKFVPLSDSNIQDPTSDDNGNVKVTFWEEEQYMCSPPPMYIKSHSPGFFFDGGSSVGTILGQSNVTMDSCCSADISYTSDVKGATVGGSTSHQKFTEGYFGGKINPVTVKLKLLAQKKVAKHCVNCGKKLKMTYKFCPDCGNKR